MDDYKPLASVSHAGQCFMNKRKRNFLKREQSKEAAAKKAKKDNLIASTIMVIIAIVFAMASPYAAKAINDGNIFLMSLPLMVLVAILIIFIIWGMLKK